MGEAASLSSVYAFGIRTSQAIFVQDIISLFAEPLFDSVVATVAHASTAPRALATEPEARARHGIAQRATASNTQNHHSRRSQFPGDRRGKPDSRSNGTP